MWGEVSKNDAINNGNVNREKIKIMGSPRFDSVKPVTNNTDDYINLYDIYSIFLVRFC